MKNILIDAGPLIALFDKDDQYHDAVITFLKEFIWMKDVSCQYFIKDLWTVFQGGYGQFKLKNNY